MAVKKQELLSVLERYWVVLSSLLVTKEELEDNGILLGTVISTTEPEQDVVWVKPTDIVVQQEEQENE